jgi:hypothetical protein
MTVLRGIFGMRRGEFDAHMLRQVDRCLHHNKVELLSLYFMGLDKESHELGPQQQGPYLREILDPQIGELINILKRNRLFDSSLVALISDHGQSATLGDDAHSIRLGFPFDQELIHLFTALGLDVHDYPGEAPHVDAVVGLNGGVAHVYLRHPQGEWDQGPRFHEDILRVAEGFSGMNKSGRYCPELKDSIDLILVRDSSSGFNSPYLVYQDTGTLLPVAEVFEERGDDNYPDAEARLRQLNGAMSGDLLLLARSDRGIYFGKPGLRGVHGGLLRDDSETTLALSIPGGNQQEQARLHDQFIEIASQRASHEGRRRISIADLTFGLRRMWSRLAP